MFHQHLCAASSGVVSLTVRETIPEDGGKMSSRREFSHKPQPSTLDIRLLHDIFCWVGDEVYEGIVRQKCWIQTWPKLTDFFLLFNLHGKEKYRSTDNTKIEIEETCQTN